MAIFLTAKVFILKMRTHLTRKQIEILHAFRAISHEFIVDDSGRLFVIVDGYPIGLAGICNAPIEMPWE